MVQTPYVLRGPESAPSVWMCKVAGPGGNDRIGQIPPCPSADGRSGGESRSDANCCARASMALNDSNRDPNRHPEESIQA
jgi:hypothetical protein